MNRVPNEVQSPVLRSLHVFCSNTRTTTRISSSQIHHLSLRNSLDHCPVHWPAMVSSLSRLSLLLVLLNDDQLGTSVIYQLLPTVSPSLSSLELRHRRTRRQSVRQSVCLLGLLSESDRRNTSTGSLSQYTACTLIIRRVWMCLFAFQPPPFTPSFSALLWLSVRINVIKQKQCS